MKAGNRNVFDSEGSYVEDKRTGGRAWLKDEGGMYVFKVGVPLGVFRGGVGQTRKTYPQWEREGDEGLGHGEQEQEQDERRRP